MGINFSGVPSGCWFGRIIRWPLRLVPPGFTLPILQGSLRGKLWVVGSFNHGCWLGSYEYTQRRLFEQSVRPGDTVYDVGAHVGFYTLLASVLVGPTGRVVALEPLRSNLFYLRRHLDLNGVRNALVVEGAAIDRAGEVRMLESSDRSQSRVDAKGTVAVRAFTLDQLVFQDGLPAPTVMKVDVEGAEYVVLRGSIKILTEKRPLLFLSTHSPQIQDECCRLLVRLGYSLRPIGGESGRTSSVLLGQG